MQLLPFLHFIRLMLMGAILIVHPVAAAYDESDLNDICNRTDKDIVHVKTVSQLTKIGARRGVFCIHSGDYRAAGKVRLPYSVQINNSPAIFIFYHPDPIVSNAHPVDRPLNQQAIIAGINFEGGSDWIVHGLTIKPAQNDVNDEPLMRFRKSSGSTHNTLEKLLVEGGGGGAGQIFITTTNDNNVLRNSVLRETRSKPHKDYHCIKINDAERIVITGNEIYDCAGDAIQVDSGGAAGGLISNNDLYITPRLYSDCAGNRSETGQCACAENAIDLKGGGRSRQGSYVPDMLEISNNRVWGFRKTDPACGGTGDAGKAIVLHWEPADYVIIKRNLIAKSDRGINVSEYSRFNPFDGTQYVSILENVFFSISGDRRRAGRALVLKKASRYEVYGNLFLETDEFLGMGNKPGTWNEFACNFIVGPSKVVGEWGAGSSVFNNVYSSAQSMPQDAAPLRITAKSDGSLRWCIDTSRIVAHEEICIQGIIDSQLATWSEHCATRSSDNRMDVGVDNAPYFLNVSGIRDNFHERTKSVSPP